jgi:hypothetical protein
VGPRGGALALEAEGRQLFASETSDLGRRDVGRERRLAEYADVDDDRLDAQLAQPLPDEGVLAALRVEGADENDGRYLRTGSALNALTTSATARSTGSRSIDDAPR